MIYGIISQTLSNFLSGLNYWNLNVCTYLVIIVKNDGFKNKMAAIFQTIFLISRNDVQTDPKSPLLPYRYIICFLKLSELLYTVC